MVHTLSDVVKEAEEMEKLVKALLNLGLVTKTAFPLLLCLLEDEVVKDSKKGNALLRGTLLPPLPSLQLFI